MGVSEMGKLIRAARGEMRQEELADLSGVSQGIISKLELGQIKNPSEEKVRAIAAALGLSATELFAAWHGMRFDVTEEEQARIVQKWRIIDLPPDVDDDELLMLKHLFRGIRGYEEDAAEREATVAAREARERRLTGRARA